MRLHRRDAGVSLPDNPALVQAWSLKREVLADTEPPCIVSLRLSSACVSYILDGQAARLHIRNARTHTLTPTDQEIRLMELTQSSHS